MSVDQFIEKWAARPEVHEAFKALLPKRPWLGPLVGGTIGTGVGAGLGYLADRFATRNLTSKELEDQKSELKKNKWVRILGGAAGGGLSGTLAGSLLGKSLYRSATGKITPEDIHQAVHKIRATDQDLAREEFVFAKPWWMPENEYRDRLQRSANARRRWDEVTRLYTQAPESSHPDFLENISKVDPYD